MKRTISILGWMVFLVITALYVLTSVMADPELKERAIINFIISMTSIILVGIKWKRFGMAATAEFTLRIAATEVTYLLGDTDPTLGNFIVSTALVFLCY